MISLAAVAVAIGTLSGHGRPALAWPSCVITVALIAIAKLHRRYAVAAVLAGMVFAATASAAWRSSADSRHLLPAMAAQHRVARVCGTAVQLRPRSIELMVRTVEQSGSAWRVGETVRVSGDPIKGVRVGERVCARGEVHPSRPDRDEPPLLRADLVQRKGIASPLRFAAGVVRNAYSRAAARALPPTQAGLLLGMTDGDTALIDDATMDNFRTTGLAHLVAVSGYNVAVFMALVMLVVRVVVRRGRWLRVAVAVPALVFFAFLTGLQPSVLRATLSAGIAMAAAAGGRVADALRAVAFAFVALILVSPDILFSVGFQLSFGATLGIILWSAPLTERLSRWLPEAKWSAAVGAGFATTIAAQLSVAPLLAWHFGRIPGLGAAANLVAIPLGGIVMLGGMATLTAASLAPFLAWAPATMRLLLDAILGAAHGFAALPSASLSVGVPIAGALTAGAAAALAGSRALRAACLALVVILVSVAGGRALGGPHVSCARGEVRALDVGQGTAVLVRAGGHSVLLDAGPPDGGIVAKLRSAGVARIDLLVASHPHRDHVEGAVDVLGRMRVERVVGPSIVGWGMGAKLVAAASKAGVPVTTAAAGSTFDAGPIHIEILAPEPGPAPDVEDPDLVNGLSLLVRLTVGGVALIAPGDLQAREQSELLDLALRAPILIAPHHGSANIDDHFVAAVHPRVVLVTVGMDNPYGLPSPKALKIFARYGPVMRTDTRGAVTLCVQPGGLDVWTEKDGRTMTPQTSAAPTIPEVFG